MAQELFEINFAALLGILFMAVFLVQNRHVDPQTRKRFWILILLELVEMIAYSAELVTATFSHRTELRVLLSVIGYSIRPCLLYIILRIYLRTQETTWITKTLWIPAVLNILVVSTAFFSDVCFGYTQENLFYRGPLGYCSHIILAVYLVILTVFTVRMTKEQKTFEQAIIYLMVLVIVFSVVIEAVFLVRSTGRTAIVLCTVFYYMYFETQEYGMEIEKSSREIQGLNTRVKSDEMTGLLNKKAFELACKGQILPDHSKSVAVIMMDIDHFKDVNDTLGHIKGDEAILDVATQLKQTFRSEDLVSRYGGDEFCACIQSVSYEALQMKLEDLCKRVSRIYYNEQGDKQVKITCSIGAMFYWTTDGLDYAHMMIDADGLLYQAKEQGRNRVVLKQKNVYSEKDRNS